MSRETKQGFGLRGEKERATFFFPRRARIALALQLPALREEEDAAADDGGNSDSDARPTLYTACEKRERKYPDDDEPAKCYLRMDS